MSPPCTCYEGDYQPGDYVHPGNRANGCTCGLCWYRYSTGMVCDGAFEHTLSLRSPERRSTLIAAREQDRREFLARQEQCPRHKAARPRHRLKQARERAGLTDEQVAPELRRLEQADTLTSEQLDECTRVYKVSRCWLSGHVGQQIDPGMADAMMSVDILPSDAAAVLEFALSIGVCSECEAKS